MPALTVQNAEIKTATVEVRTLTISGKQVTQAVFRQLENENLLSSTLTLAGIPWGRVNYHPDKACSRSGPHRDPYSFDRHPEYCNGEHMHVVWQKGSELRRALVWDECDCSNPRNPAWAEWNGRRGELFRSLLDLPQLFIAV